MCLKQLVGRVELRCIRHWALGISLMVNGNAKNSIVVKPILVRVGLKSFEISPGKGPMHWALFISSINNQPIRATDRDTKEIS